MDVAPQFIRLKNDADEVLTPSTLRDIANATPTPLLHLTVELRVKDSLGIRRPRADSRNNYPELSVCSIADEAAVSGKGHPSDRIFVEFAAQQHRYDGIESIGGSFHCIL